MTPIETFNTNKITSNKLSDQVKQLLHEKGFSFLFNWSDYAYYKAQVKKAFNKSQAIAELFIQDNNQKSDFNEYVL